MKIQDGGRLILKSSFFPKFKNLGLLFLAFFGHYLMWVMSEYPFENVLAKTEENCVAYVKPMGNKPH